MSTSQKDNDIGDKSTFRKWVGILKTVSMEPAALCLVASELLCYLLFQNLLIENVCLVSRNNSKEVCAQVVNSPGYSDEEIEIQKIVAETRIYRSLLDNGFPILFVIFMGPWSDHYGRKVPLLIPMFGRIVHAIVLILCSLYYDSLAPHVLNIVTALARSVTGGQVVFAMAAYSYISDKTDHKDRTVRTGMLNAGIQLGIPLGFAIGGELISRQIGYVWSFAISGIISLVGFVILLATVENKTKAERDKDMEDCGVGVGVVENICVKNVNTQPDNDCWSNVNPITNFYQVFALPFKNREKSDQLKIWLLLITFICSAAPIHGEFGVMYLFLRERLGWNAVNFGDFSSYNWFMGVSGVTLSMAIFSKWLKLSDPIVGFIAGVSQLCGCMIYAMAVTAFMMYLAPTVDMMNGTMHVIARAMLSKIVDPNEIGKLFTLVAIIELVLPIAVDPLYSTIYRLTVDIFSGSFILLSAALTIPPQLIYLWFIWMQWSRSPKLVR